MRSLNYYLKRMIQVAIVATLLVAAPVHLRAEPDLPTFRIRLFNTHTGHRLDLVYRVGDTFVPAALTQLESFLCDHRNGRELPFDPSLFNVLTDLARSVGRAGAEFQVISAYRTPETNAMLGATRSGIAKHSLHMEARAIDIRLPDTPTARLRDAAIAMRRGGVGYYRDLDFIHVDTGPVRRW